ncbi:hypothetical protein Cenrod_1969 [Candidatus Symbiobacter mobilis CR]|uniref:Uncharacterized protein n=1 Tax=Candidatus Symbiobacter mobilis CR TaxID=946483 RepID=U5N9Q2_9BURK|nr:hypothetical protein Cenrod_1969 [Candidatus Symbiobacter mobilis CR]
MGTGKTGKSPLSIFPPPGRALEPVAVVEPYRARMTEGWPEVGCPWRMASPFGRAYFAERDR